MLKNNFINKKDNLKLLQKAIMAGIGVTTSKEKIKKAAYGIYDDIQKIVLALVKDLEKNGELKAKETKAIIKDLQKKSETEKVKIYRSLQKEGKNLINLTKEIMLIPKTIMKEITETLSKTPGTTNGVRAKSTSKKKTTKRSRRK